MSDLAAEFPLGSKVYDTGQLTMYVIGYVTEDGGVASEGAATDLLCSSFDPAVDPELAQTYRAGVPTWHARFMRDRFGHDLTA